MAAFYGRVSGGDVGTHAILGELAAQAGGYGVARVCPWNQRLDDVLCFHADLHACPCCDAVSIDAPEGGGG